MEYKHIIILISIILIFLIIEYNVTQLLNMNLESYENNENNIVFIIPSTSRNLDYKNIKECYLISILYESLKKLNISNYTFLIGVDDDDKFYNNNIKNIKNELPNNFIFYSLNNHDKSYVCIVNQLANIAINQYNAEYIYVFADDLEVTDLNFISDTFIPYFKNNNNLCLGWVLDGENINLCTHPFVSKKHIEYLGYFYPPSIKNWYCDNWIQKLYTKLNKIINTKNIYIHNKYIAKDEPNSKNRYDIYLVNEELLNKLVLDAFEVLSNNL